MTLASLLLEHPFRDDEALLHTADRSMTAGEARAAARRVAGRLAETGEVAGRAVAVQLPNEPELVATMVGVWLAGGVYVPLNPRLPEGEVDEVVRSTGAVAVVTEDGIRRLAGDDSPEPRDHYEDDVAFVMWTSGTTGRPRAIHHTHTAYVELLDRVLGPLRAGGTSAKRPTPNLIPVSMALNAGLYNALFGLRAGAALVIMDRFEPAAFARLVRRFEIRSTVLPPAAMAMLTDSEVTDLAPLRYVRSITAPLSPLQARRFTAKFPVYVLNGYGQAEIGEVIGWTAADAKAHPDKVGAVGRPHPGVDIRIDDDGHLWVRPPNTAVGIDERLDADGYVDTGDLARVDEDGFVWIEGRAGDLINRGGNKVHPDAVEEVLRLSPAVDDVAVVGAPDDRLGEVPVAFLVGRPVPDDELVALCREHLVAYKVPAAFRWVDALPRSEVGKVLRADLARTLAASSSPRREPPAPTGRA
ncbi:MAG: long-chain fatty acid--CoA ligase [Acidimicrobiales bacterium]|nr:long-chain fatty acid--CoA ligase [Acidimicrobiales bacterium]